MNWPWVSRVALERAINASYDANARAIEADARAAAAAELLASERRRYDSLLDKFTALRVAGAVPEPKAVEAAPIGPLAADPLRALIHERAGSDYRLRAMMLRQLEADRRDGVDEDAITARIEMGVQADGVPT